MTQGKKIKLRSSTVVITMAFRTPLCKSRKGGYKDMKSDELLTAVYRVSFNISTSRDTLVN